MMSEMMTMTMMMIMEMMIRMMIMTKQDPSRCQTYDVVIFEEHDDIPKMEQVMWPRHCVQVGFFFIVVFIILFTIIISFTITVINIIINSPLTIIQMTKS